MITIGIIVVNVILSFAAFQNSALFDRLCFMPYAIRQDKRQWFRAVSGGFIHANVPHLLFNMLTLFFFGSVLEKSLFSPTEYVLFYFSALLASSAPAYQKHKDQPTYRAVGASGAVSAVVFVLALYYPWSLVYLKFFIPLYFILYAVGYLLYSAYMVKRGNDHIAHDAHLWGALYGLAFCLVMHPSSLRIFLDQLVDPPFLK